jgi:hypothetical protein
MECIRCHAQDTDSARFCRQCGYPFAFDELMTCPVCAGEVRTGSKVCPGCQHVFAMPVAIRHEPPPLARSHRYIVPALVLFAVTGFGFFYAIADLEGAREHLTYPKVEEAPALPTPPLEAVAPSPPAPVEVTAPAISPYVEIADTHATEPEPAVIEEPLTEVKRGVKQVSAKATSKRAREDKSPAVEKKVPAHAAAEPQEPQERQEPTPSAGPEAESLRAEAAAEHLQPISTQSAVDKPKPAEPSEYRERRDSRALVGRAAVAAVDRIKASPRAVPVVERSRAAQASQNARLAQEIRRDCSDGRWEGACRQFPDHKPKW